MSASESMLLLHEAAFSGDFSVAEQHTSSQIVEDSAWGSGLRSLQIQLMDLTCDCTGIFIINMILLVKCVHCHIKTI